ncbi:unnamed protein product [Durusdinium trenchii]|uniref:Uncharacterized protein n=1 Tax=Durusdinium trenchii TaxID=1381693 RepID=A0ABP0LZY5_9DINO
MAVLSLSTWAPASLAGRPLHDRYTLHDRRQFSVPSLLGRRIQLMARTVRRSSGLVAISVIAVFLQAADARRATLGDKLEGVYELPPEEETVPGESVGKKMETAASMDSMDMLSDIHGPFVLYIVGLFSLRKFEEEPEAPEKPPMPERRVPYSMHIVTQLPQHKHLKEESNAQHYIEEKVPSPLILPFGIAAAQTPIKIHQVFEVVGALENFEDFIRHVEDNFHREKRPEKAKAKSPLVDQTFLKGSADVVDEEEDVIPSPPEKEWGHKVLMPYVFKAQGFATVTLVNHHKIALSNPEKHAQASLQDHATAGGVEATDHMVDVLRKSLREEKNRMISNKRKQAESMPDDMDDMEAYNKENGELSDAVVEAKASEDDEEALYQRIEAGVGPDGWAVISGKKPEMCVFGEEEWGEGQNRELVRKVKPETVTRFLRFIRVLGPLDTWLLFLKALCNPQNDGAISDKQQLVLSKIAFAGTAWRLLLKLVIEVQAFIMNEGWAIRFGGLDPCDQEPDQDDQGSSSSTSDLVDALLQVSKIMNSTGWPGTDSRRVGGMLSQLLTLTRLKQYPRGGVCSFGIFGQAARLAPLQVTTQAAYLGTHLDDAGEGLHLDFQSP